MSAHTSIEMANHYYRKDNYTRLEEKEINSSSREYTAIPSTGDTSYCNPDDKNLTYVIGGKSPSNELQSCDSYYIQTSHGSHMTTSLIDARSKKHRKRSRKCCIKVYAWMVSVAVATFFTIIVVGFSVVRPYLKVHGFIDSYCLPSDSVYSDSPNTCWCGKGCKSSHPCLKILVVPDLRDEGVTFRNASQLSENETARGKCSFYPPCKSSRAANERAVQNYKHKYGVVGQRFPCLYNPENPSEVIRTRRFHLTHVVHGLVWSSLAFLFSLSILIFAIRKKGCDFL